MFEYLLTFPPPFRDYKQVHSIPISRFTHINDGDAFLDHLPGQDTVQLKEQLNLVNNVPEPQKLSKAVGKAQNGNLSEALKLFKNVLEVIPEHVEARRNLAKVYFELGNMDQAKRQLDVCIQINPKDCWSYIMLGNIYTKHERNLDVAEFYYECGLEHCPEDGMLLNNYANLMMEKGKFSRAEELFKKTLNLKPVHPHSYFGLALLYRVTGHPEESLKVLERLFILMPKTPGIESTQLYTEARNLYSEIKAAIGSKASTH